MELLSWQQWLDHGLIMIVMLLMAFSLWSERKSAKRTGVRYFSALGGLLMAALDMVSLFVTPQIPLAFRILHYLAIAFLVSMSVVTWPRKRS